MENAFESLLFYANRLGFMQIRRESMISIYAGRFQLIFCNISGNYWWKLVSLIAIWQNWVHF